MKLKVSLKDKEASLDADLEKLIEKKMDNDSKKPKLPKKSKHQIRQEEKRKTLALQHQQREETKKAEYKRNLIIALLCFGAFAAIIILCLVMSQFE